MRGGWSDLVAVFLLRLFARMPLRCNLWLGRRAGALLWWLDGRERRVALANLAFCFPDRSAKWRRDTARAALVSMSEALFEAPRVWRMSRHELLTRLDNPQVLDDILREYHDSKGLVIASPHLGSWEFAGSVIATGIQMTNMFRPPKSPAVGRYIRQARERGGCLLVPTDASGVRMLSKTLAKGGCVGILPDQEPDAGNGIYAPFFGRQAYTMFLLPRLVRKRRTPVLFVFAERLPGGRYRLHHRHADDALYSDDAATACAAMNAVVEALVRGRIDQYNWNYKRFLAQPDGSNIYQKDT
ncbi:MAG TPA: lipid A biosynthesis acyltransferase [Rhodobacteraceae bacterium]|nr:lipid A biosynthesis acyltransferase [Paracoccaceae bacterium]